MEAILRVDGLTKRFRRLTAVDAISFDVRPGELFGIVGPDGAGKTTTLRMLAGVMTPTAGEAIVDGLRLTREAEKIKSVIAYMSQRFGLYGDMTVAENIEFYADLYRVPHDERLQREERLFRFSGLAPFRDRLAGQLSGGMKQKLGLSCALVHEPKLLLLDEPTFGVDPISRRDLWIIVHEMVSHGVTVVVTTSYLDEAERFDRVAFLHRGRILALDTPDALLRSLGGHLMSVRTSSPRRAREVVEKLPVAEGVVAYGRDLHVRVADISSGQVVAAALRAAGIESTDPVEVGPSLETIFIDRVLRAEATA